MPAGNEIAAYSSYLKAQQAVDALSDAGFEVRTVTIVGHDLHMVERVTGRLTYPRVAFAGFASGAWFGLFVGLLMSLFSSADGQFTSILPAMLIGGAFGLLFSIISYALQRGKRDFTSQSQIVAAKYVILCDPTTAGQARQILSEKGFGGDVEAPRPPTVVSRPVDYSVPPEYGVRTNTPAGTVAGTEGAPAPTTTPDGGRPLTYGEALDAQRRAAQQPQVTPSQAPQPANAPTADAQVNAPTADPQAIAGAQAGTDSLGTTQPQSSADANQDLPTRRKLKNPDNPFSPPADQD